MDAFSRHALQNARETIEARISDRTTRLVNTKAEDYAKYSERVGEIKGLMEALAVMAEAEKDLGRAEIKSDPAPVQGRRYED